MWAISDRLYLGNYWSGEQALTGAEASVQPADVPARVRGVVSLCPMPLDGESFTGPIHDSVQWLHLPISDGGLGEGEFAAALKLVLPFVASHRRRGNVLVHCAAGMSRSVSVVAAVLCSENRHLDVEAAFRRIARAKAKALGVMPEDESQMIAPAWEFQSHLQRRFNKSRRRANGRSSQYP